VLKVAKVMAMPEFIDKGEYREIRKVRRSKMTNIPALLVFKKEVKSNHTKQKTSWTIGGGTSMPNFAS
jgi:hypothetical protein